MRYLPVVAAVWTSLAAAQMTGETRNLELNQALLGDWTGTLEYRDYSEAATSEKRVKLPTWLRVSSAKSDTGLRFEYVYDDGPGKVVREGQVVRFDIAQALYVSISESKEKGKEQEGERYAVNGLGELKAGRGTLVFDWLWRRKREAGQRTHDDAHPAHLLEILKETGAAGEPLLFRHAYTMVRAAVPEK